MYRILAGEGKCANAATNSPIRRTRSRSLLATGPNQLWSWDITKLLGPAKWTYFYLYVILDVFSRYVVGWMVAPRESAELAKQLIAETCDKQGIAPGQLTIHADRGSSMTSKPVALLLADLGVTKTHSRPHVSDDNPFSESQFKTLKYRPELPGPLRLHPGRPCLLPAFLPLVQQRAPPLRHRPAHPGHGPLRPGRRRHRAPAGRARRRLPAPTRSASSAAARTLAIPKEVWINKPPENKIQ